MIYSEGFSRLIRRMVAEGSWRGIKICPQAPELTHLFFADDSLLFLQPNNDGVNALQKIL